jgi:hypothetical protein
MLIYRIHWIVGLLSTSHVYQTDRQYTVQIAARVKWVRDEIRLKRKASHKFPVYQIILFNCNSYQQIKNCKAVKITCNVSFHTQDNQKYNNTHAGLLQVLRLPASWSLHILRQSVPVGGKVVSPTHRPPLPSRKIILVLISVRCWVDPRAIVRPVIPSGFEPAALRLVTQRLNQLRHRVLMGRTYWD